jgi:hypothetical protein
MSHTYCRNWYSLLYLDLVQARIASSRFYDSGARWSVVVFFCLYVSGYRLGWAGLASQLFGLQIPRFPGPQAPRLPGTTKSAIGLVL